MLGCAAMRRLTFISAVAALCVRALPAAAAGLGIPDLGAGALGQGAAGIAAPADLTAVYYNPAGLARLDGLRLHLDVRSAMHEVTFARTPATDFYDEFDPPLLTVENRGGRATAPLFGVSYQLRREGLPRVTLALGGHPSTGYTGYRFPDPADFPTPEKCSKCEVDTERRTPQRYSLISNNSLSYTASLAAGVQVNDWLSLGATLQNQMVRFVSRQAIAANPFAPSEQYVYDALLELDAADWFTPVGSLGASIRLAHGLSVGGSFQLPATVEPKGTLRVKVPPKLETLGASVEGDQVAMKLSLPWIARLGVRWVRPQFELELAGTWDAWSRYQSVGLVPDGIVFKTSEGEKALPPFQLPKGMVDAQSLRLGGVFKPGAFWPQLAWLTLRAGLLAETSAVPLERTAIDQAHWERVAGTVGLGARLGAFDFALSYATFSQPDRVVTDSAVRQPAPLRPPEEAVAVGNGTFRSRIDLLALSTSARFDL